MSTTTESERVSAADGTRRRLRLVTTSLCAIVAVLYLVLAVLVARAQSSPDWTMESIYGLYLFAAVPYLAGVVISIRVDRPVVWALGALGQVAMIAGFLWLGLQLVGPRGPEEEPTVFDYEPLSGLGMGWWAAAIIAAQVVLLGVLSYLALVPSKRQASAATT
jgi:hypothetical protein